MLVHILFIYDMFHCYTHFIMLKVQRDDEADIDSGFSHGKDRKCRLMLQL